MCADYARYDSPANAPDSSASLTAKEREELHRQLTQPGVVRLDGSGQVQYSQPAEAVRPNTPAPGTRIMHNGKPCFVSREGEFIPVDVAANYPPELFRPFSPDASAEAASKSGDQPQSQQPESLTWSHPDANAVMTEMGSQLPESVIENMVALAADGTRELTDYVAQSMVSGIPGLDPMLMKENFAKAVNAAQEAADQMVSELGVDPDVFYASMQDGERHDIADAFARGDASKLVNAATVYRARFGEVKQPEVTVAELYDTSAKHQVNGGRLWMDGNKHMVTIGDTTVTFEQALKSGWVRVRTM